MFEYFFKNVDEHVGALLIAIVLSLWIEKIIWQMIFDSWEDFLDCLKAWYLPVWLSIFRGEHEGLAGKIFSVAFFFLICFFVNAALYRACLYATHFF